MPTPCEGNTFASRNGLSNRFSHMDQPQSLRHLYEPESKATRDERHAHRYRPERTTETARLPARRWKTDVLPSRAQRSGDDSPGSPTGVEKGADKSEGGAYEAELRVGQVLPAGFSTVPDIFRVKRKGILGQVAASDGFSTISATLSTLSKVCWTSVSIPIHTSISKPFLTWRYSM